MNQLTLPIVVGKKYVRRDGKVVSPTLISPSCEATYPPMFLCVDPGQGPVSKNCVYTAHGLIFGTQRKDDFDLVSDYIEPAKGHPHAALMMEFAKDAAESETPWDRWELLQSGGNWVSCGRGISFDSRVEYRRKPTVTPDPHAENAAEYAKDMAETDKAWNRWEQKQEGGVYWLELDGHPKWERGFKYQRKEQA